jgi:peptidyl-prolyl cis-trans isomerase SDCCAG10
LNLLSFGEQEEEEEPTIKKTKMKSAYDFIDDAVPTPTELVEELTNKVDTKVNPPATMLEKLKEKVRESDLKRKQHEKELELEQEKEREQEQQQKKQKEQQQQQVEPPSTTTAIDQLKQDIRNISKPTQSPPPTSAPREKKKSLVALEREKYMSSATKKKKSNKKSSTVDDTDVLNKLMAFQKKLSTAGAVGPLPSKEKKRCQLHDIPGCESCFDLSLEEEEQTDEGWISHQLVFDKDLKGKDLMQRKETVDDYVVIDPRDREAKAKQEEFDRKRSIKSKVSPAFRQDDSRKRRRGDDGRDNSRRKYDDDRSNRRYDDNRSSSRRYDDYKS